MKRYGFRIPQLDGGLFLTDGGIETTLVFHEKISLPDFASFTLLKTREGEAILKNCYREYARVARKFGTGVILESASWRASADWGKRLGYTRETLAAAVRDSVRMLEEIREEDEFAGMDFVVSGCFGPRGDGYVADKLMTEREAEQYHMEQATTLAATNADMLCAMTINYAEEAVGIARAAQQVRRPVAISFTLETDGRLVTGQSLREAIEQVDAATSNFPAYYMINCAHPTHFESALAAGEPWAQRIRGIRANASRRSHAELNDSPDLDAGNPVELGEQYGQLRRTLGHLNVLGGCCGTDARHVEKIAESVCGEMTAV